MVADFFKNKNNSMSLKTFSTTCFEKRGGPAAPSYPICSDTGYLKENQEQYIIREYLRNIEVHSATLLHL